MRTFPIKTIYVTVKLPRPTIEQIDTFVKEDSFTSRTDFLKYLVRSYRLKQNN